MRDPETVQNRPLTAAVSFRGPPVRLQRSRRPGANLAQESLDRNGRPAVNVCRPGIFGNPFVHPDPAEAVAAYRRLVEPKATFKEFKIEPGGLQFAGRFHPDTTHFAYADWLRDKGLPAIAEANVACFCAVDAPCHGDVLLELAAPFRCTEETGR